MNQKRLAYFALEIIIGLVIFGFSLSYLSNKAEDKTITGEIPKPIFIATGKGQALSQKQAKGRGIWEIGDFTKFQLEEENSELEITNLEFDPATKKVTEVIGDVKNGSVLAINLVFGPKIELTNKNVAVSNRGGSFILETQGDASRIEVLSGSVNASVRSPAGGKPFEAALNIGQEITLDKANLEKIFASEDALQRNYAWIQLITKSKNHFDQESLLVSRILKQFPTPEEKNFFTENLAKVREALLFSPSAKKDFHWQKIKEAFGKTISGEKNALAAYFVKAPPAERNLLKEVVKKTAIYTQIFLSENLSPKIKEDVMNLAAVFPQIEKFSGLADLDVETKLMRNLALANTDPKNTEYADAFGEQAFDQSIKNNQELAVVLIGLLQNNQKIANEKWLENFEKINSLKIENPEGLAAAIVNQLKLIEVLVGANQTKLGEKALSNFTNLISLGKDKFEAKLLAKLDLANNDLKNKIAFLANSHSAAEENFDEAAYEIWLAEQGQDLTVEKPNPAEAQMEIVVVEEEPTLKPASEISEGQNNPELKKEAATPPPATTVEKTTPAAEATPPKKVPRSRK